MHWSWPLNVPGGLGHTSHTLLVALHLLSHPWLWHRGLLSSWSALLDTRGLPGARAQPLWSRAGKVLLSWCSSIRTSCGLSFCYSLRGRFYFILFYPKWSPSSGRRSAWALLQLMSGRWGSLGAGRAWSGCGQRRACCRHPHPPEPCSCGHVWFYLTILL